MEKPKKRILIAVYTEILQDALREKLEDRYEVAVCSNAPTAYRLLEEVKPDVLLADLVLPGETDMTFIRKSRERFPDMKILVYLNFSSLYIQHRLAQMHINKLVAVPGDLKATVRWIDEVCSADG